MTKLIERTFALCIVITMQTVYMKLDGSQIDIVLSGLCVFLALLLIVDKGKVTLSVRLFHKLIWANFLFILLLVCQYIFLSQQGVNIFASLLISALCVLFFSLCVIWFSSSDGSMHRLGSYVVDSIFWTTLISLILFVFGQTLHLISPTNTVAIQWGGVRTTSSYFYLLFTPQAYSGYHGFAQGRFTGIFTEAPMFSFILCVGLIGLLFFNEGKTKLFRVATIGIAIFFTVSTTGYIIGILSVGLFFILSKGKSSSLRLFVKLFSLLILCVAVGYAVTLYQQKLVLDVGSVTVRSNNFQNALVRFFESPIFGHGFKSDELGTTGGDTSVMSQIIQQGGLLFAYWYFLPIVSTLFLCLKKRNYKGLVVIILYLMMLYTTVVTYTTLSILVIAMFFVISNHAYKPPSEMVAKLRMVSTPKMTRIKNE